MPMRQRIGLSLALLMISTAAFAGIPEKNGSEPLIQPPTNPARGAARAARSRSARKAAHRRTVAHASARHARAFDEPARSRPAEPQSAVLRATGRGQVGTAAWYALDGGRTASGERMDGARATAAHRSLPLLSYARVTNLRNGRSIVVEINDRGPMSHRFVIDLSRRAAEAIGMMHNGVARVEVQPVAAETPQGERRIAAVE
ncbi:MAG TPA: septal ring lytic transglycosylase RlpA family protein [Stellaceae bacterium]|nr:septal ring lytic transglycosylase RlpA family protein [Stellaceae bacterium]